MARQLARLGVDIIEAGFPIASPGDFESVRAIAAEVNGRSSAAWRGATGGHRPRREAVRDAARPRIHVFLATSAIHREHKLQMTREDVKGLARAAVRAGQGAPGRRRVLPEDATRDRGRVPRRGRRERRSTRARRPSTSPTRSATPRRTSTRGSSRPERSWSRSCTTSRCRSTATTTWAWPSPTRLAGVRGRRPAGRVHDQRHRRARGQRRARGDRHGAAHARRLLRPRHRHQDRRRSTRSAGWSRV